MKNTHFKKAFSFALILCIVLALSAPALAITESELNSAIYDTAEYVMQTVENPSVDSIGGEWAVLALARSGIDIPQSYIDNYYKTVEEYVKECEGVLHEKKYTEYSRVIIALSSIGADPKNVSGYNLLTPLGDFENTIWQGINGPIWALIALDCKNYEMPENKSAKIQATRQMYVDEILSRQLSCGGWSLNGSGGSNEIGDPDITAMALQALSKYLHQSDVKNAVEKAVLFLSNIQDENGGYQSFSGINCESIAQVIVALCELDIDLDDSRFVKNGVTLLDNLMSYYKKGNGFVHTSQGDGVNQMSTEQALYSMVAAMRQKEGLPGLYSMTDVKLHVSNISVEKAGLSGKHEDVNPPDITKTEEYTFSDITDHKNKSAIEALSSRGIINGVTKDAFMPDNTMTRAQFCAITVRALGLPLNIGNTFSDVPDEAWYASYIETAYLYGIVNGTGEDKFSPDGLITREQAAAMLSRAGALCGMNTDINDVSIKDTLAPFGDYITISDWAKPSVAFCYRENIFDNEDLNTEPQRNILRCEIAQMIYNLLTNAKLI